MENSYATKLKEFKKHFELHQVLDIQIANEVEDQLFNTEHEDFEEVCDYVRQVYMKDDSCTVTFDGIVEAINNYLQEIGNLDELLAIPPREFIIQHYTF